MKTATWFVPALLALPFVVVVVVDVVYLVALPPVADVDLLAGEGIRFEPVESGNGAGAVPEPIQGEPGEEPRHDRSVVVDRKSGRVVVRRAGRLLVPFEVPVPQSRLEWRYRFREPDAAARARVTLGRRFEEPGRFDVVFERTLTPEDSGRGRVRKALDEKDEVWVLIVDVNEPAARGGFVIIEPRVVVAPGSAKKRGT